MEQQYIAEQSFEKQNFSKEPLPPGEYEACYFSNCNFTNSPLSGIRFIECEFSDCNLSTAILNDTFFQDVEFRDCKLIGLQFDRCNDFGFSVNFEHCKLSHSSFYRLRLTKTSFLNSVLHEVDFTETDLSESIFDKCDLLRANFENSVLEKTDFSNAYNYSIDPEINRIKGAKFSYPGLTGLLDKYDIRIIQDN